MGISGLGFSWIAACRPRGRHSEQTRRSGYRLDSGVGASLERPGVAGGRPVAPTQGWRCLANRLLAIRKDRAQWRGAGSVRRLDLEPTRPLRFAHPGSLSADYVQYFGTVGSTLSLHAKIPPFMLRTLRNPACFRNSTAFALRIPLLQ